MFAKKCNLPTLQPPREEQQAICAHPDKKPAAVKCIVAGIEVPIETLTAYRKSLVHKCVTGQRRISDSDLAAMKRTEADPPKPHEI